MKTHSWTWCRSLTVAHDPCLLLWPPTLPFSACIPWFWQPDLTFGLCQRLLLSPLKSPSLILPDKLQFFLHNPTYTTPPRGALSRTNAHHLCAPIAPRRHLCQLPDTEYWAILHISTFYMWRKTCLGCLYHFSSCLAYRMLSEMYRDQRKSPPPQHILCSSIQYLHYTNPWR